MAERNTVPNLEAKATDGNPVFTPKQWPGNSANGNIK